MTWLDRGRRDELVTHPARRPQPAAARCVQHTFARSAESHRLAHRADHRHRRHADPCAQSRGTGSNARPRRQAVARQPRRALSVDRSKPTSSVVGAPFAGNATRFLERDRSPRRRRRRGENDSAPPSPQSFATPHARPPLEHRLSYTPSTRHNLHRGGSVRPCRAATRADRRPRREDGGSRPRSECRLRHRGGRPVRPVEGDQGPSRPRAARPAQDRALKRHHQARDPRGARASPVGRPQAPGPHGRSGRATRRPRRRSATRPPPPTPGRRACRGPPHLVRTRRSIQPTSGVGGSSHGSVTTTSSESWARSSCRRTSSAAVAGHRRTSIHV